MATERSIISPVNVKERGTLDLQAGDTVRVWQKIQEKGKTRLQAFEGLVLARKHGAEAGGSFTDWTGVARIDGGDAISTNRHVLAEVLALIQA